MKVVSLQHCITLYRFAYRKRNILSLQYVYFSIVGWRIFARYFSPVELAISSNVGTYKEKSIGFIAIYVSQHRYLYHRVSICVFVFVLCLRGRQLGGHRHVPRLPETIHPLVLNAPSLFQTPLGTIIRWVRELSNLPTVDLKSSPKLAYTVKKGTEILFLSSDNVAVYCERISLVWESFFQRIVKREKEKKEKRTRLLKSSRRVRKIERKTLSTDAMIRWLVFTGGMLFVLLSLFGEAYVDRT